MVQRLESVEIEGFKSIARANVELRSLNVLIGANGSGKSNFIGALEFLLRVSQRGLQDTVRLRGGAERLLRFGRKVTPELKLKLHFSDVSWECAFAPDDAGSLLLTENTRSRDGYRGTGPVPQFLQPESDLADATLRKEPDAMAAWNGVEGIRVFHFHDTSREARVKQPQPLADNRTLKSDAQNLGPVLHRMKQAHGPHYERLVKTVRLVAPYFRDFDLRPNGPTGDSIRVGWYETGSESLHDLHGMSDGTLRFICLATALFQPERPRVFVLDEPELGLHPAAIQMLAGLLRSARDEHGVQLIAATQSVSLVNQLEDPEDVIVVDRDPEDGTQFHRPDNLTNWLDGYALGELWEKNLLGGRPR